MASTQRQSVESYSLEWYHTWMFWAVLAMGLIILLVLLAIGICLILLIRRKKKEDTTGIGGKQLGARNEEAKQAETNLALPPIIKVEPKPMAVTVDKPVAVKLQEPAAMKEAKKDDTPEAKNPPISKKASVKVASKMVKSEKGDLLNIIELEKQLTEHDGKDAFTFGALLKKEDRKKLGEDKKEENEEEENEEEIETSEKAEALLNAKVYDDNEKPYDNLTQFVQPQPESDPATKQSNNSGGSPATLSPEPTVNPTIAKTAHISKVNTANISKANTANIISKAK